MDRDAERELCRKYAGRIRGYGLRHLRDRAGAEDLVQQVLFTLLKATREGRAGDPERLDGWVLVTCRNTVMDMRRGDQRQQRLAAQVAADALAGYEPDWIAVEHGPLQERLMECLRALEPRDRAVVLATFVEDRDADEIGASLHLTGGNVRVIRHRTLARLQLCIEGTGRTGRTGL